MVEFKVALKRYQKHFSPSFNYTIVIIQINVDHLVIEFSANFSKLSESEASLLIQFVQDMLMYLQLVKCTESPCWPVECRGWSLHWAAWPCCPGPVSSGDSWGSWMSLWRQTSQHTPVHLYNRFWSWIWSVPGLKRGHTVQCAMQTSLYFRPKPANYKSLSTCNIPKLESDFFFIRPVQHLDRKVH